MYNGAKPTWNSVTNSLKLSNLTKDKTSCMLYFDETESRKVLANLKREESTEEPDFSKTDETEHLDSTGKTQLFKAEDDFGESYYFRGKVKDNWVQFGNMNPDGNPIWWRIIRINGDGSIRLIYAGIGKTAKDLTIDEGYVGNTNSQIENNKKYQFNVKHNNSTFAGYLYGNNGQNLHTTNTTESNVYSELKSWFEINLKDEWNDGNGQIDPNVGFCGDRSNNSSSSFSWTEEMEDTYPNAGTKTTFFGAYLRLANNKQPTYKCGKLENKNNDYYTYKNAEGIKTKIGEVISGNKKLEYPIGLITIDEAYYAGGLYESNNTNYYLYSNIDYWTITPYYFYYSSDSDTRVCRIGTLGDLYGYGVNNTYGLRPVINLKSTVEFTTNPDSEDLPGTINNPYIVN